MQRVFPAFVIFRLITRRQLLVPVTNIVNPGDSITIPGEGLPKPKGGKVSFCDNSTAAAITELQCITECIRYVSQNADVSESEQLTAIDTETES